MKCLLTAYCDDETNWKTLPIGGLIFYLGCMKMQFCITYELFFSKTYLETNAFYFFFQSVHFFEC